MNQFEVTFRDKDEKLRVSTMSAEIFKTKIKLKIYKNQIIISNSLTVWNFCAEKRKRGQR